jgi:hypothetical protein
MDGDSCSDKIFYEIVDTSLVLNRKWPLRINATVNDDFDLIQYQHNLYIMNKEYQLNLTHEGEMWIVQFKAPFLNDALFLCSQHFHFTFKSKKVKYSGAWLTCKSSNIQISEYAEEVENDRW